MAATGFFQSLLDLTVEEALTKYGFRYATAEDWGRLRRLFRARARAEARWAACSRGSRCSRSRRSRTRSSARTGLLLPLVIAAALPLAQAPESVAATALLLRGRYDLRALFHAFSMGLRLVAIAIGAQYGLTETIVGDRAGAGRRRPPRSASPGLVAFRRFPRAPADAARRGPSRDLAFVLQSSAATGLVSLRTALAPLLLGIVAGPVQVGSSASRRRRRPASTRASAPVRLILLTEQTRDWERGGHERVLRRRAPLHARRGRCSWWSSCRCSLARCRDLIEARLRARVLPTRPTPPGSCSSRPRSSSSSAGRSRFPVSIGRPSLRLVTHGVETVVLVPLVLVLGARAGARPARPPRCSSRRSSSRCVWTVLFVRIRREPRCSRGGGRDREGPRRLRDLAARRRRPGEPRTRASRRSCTRRGHEVEVVTTADAAPAPEAYPVHWVSRRSRSASGTSRSPRSSPGARARPTSSTRPACSAARRSARALARRPLVVKLTADPAYERARRAGLCRAATLDEFQGAAAARGAALLRRARDLDAAARRARRRAERVPARARARLGRAAGARDRAPEPGAAAARASAARGAPRASSASTGRRSASPGG